MVETTSKPTDISKIQDIMNAISSNDSSDKTGLKVDYAAGSKLESGINELKMIGKEQAGYLKKMVGYQDTMLQNARSESVSSAASNAKNNVTDEKPKSALAAAGSAALMSVLGPLGPILGQLATGLGALGAGVVGGAGVARLRGGAGADRINNTASAKDFKLGGDYDTAPPPNNKKPSKLLTVDERLAAQRFDAQRITSSNSPFKLTKDMRVNSADLKYKAMAMTDAELADAMKTSKSPELANELQRRLTLKNLPDLSVPDPLKLTKEMRVAPTAEIPTKVAGVKGAGIKGAGALGAVLSGGMGYFDKELKDAGLNSIERIGQGLLESIPGAIDMFTRGLVTDPLNTFTGRGFGPEEDKFNFDITPLFRKFMLEEMSKTKSDNSTMAVAPNRMTAFKTAMTPTTVPNTTITPPPAAPIVIAPPAAPASSVVNSNNQQTTIINQTKDVSASLYLHMLGVN